VTTPGEGVFAYDAGTVVNLVATAEAGYQFVKWSGDVDAPNSAVAHATVNTDKSVYANFIQTKSIYVADIAMSVVSSWGGKNAKAVVTVRDYQGKPVSGAKVKATWSGLVSANVSGTTRTDGTIIFNSKKTLKKGTITFTVTGVSKTGYIYNPSQNVETKDFVLIQ
jgi:hypothetical protein